MKRSLTTTTQGLILAATVLLLLGACRTPVPPTDQPTGSLTPTTQETTVPPTAEPTNTPAPEASPSPTPDIVVTLPGPIYTITPEPLPLPGPVYSLYTVEKGDWVWKIAGRLGVDPRVVCKLNRSVIPNCSLIHPGDILLIPSNNP